MVVGHHRVCLFSSVRFVTSMDVKQEPQNGSDLQNSPLGYYSHRNNADAEKHEGVVGLWVLHTCVEGFLAQIGTLILDLGELLTL